MTQGNTAFKSQASGLARVDALSPNPWNTNRMGPEEEKKLEASIRRLEMFKPIVVRETEDGELQILGGQHRWEIAMKIGMKEIPVYNLGQISDTKAKEIGLVDNARYGADDSLSLGELLRELNQESPIAEFLPFTDMELDNLFSSSIALEDLELDDSDTPPPPAPEKAAPTSQVLRFKIPVEDVARLTNLIDSVMKSQNFTQEDSLTNAGHALIYILKDRM